MESVVFEGFRLSVQQRHLWSVARNNPAYCAQCAVELQGEIDLKILRGVLQSLVQRHEILRTTFDCPPGMAVPLQVIQDDPKLYLQEIDLTGITPSQQEERCAELCSAQAQAPFDFSRGPLLRLDLLRLSPTSHRLLITQPALCSDAASMRNLLEEMSNSYAAMLEGRELSVEVVQYADFSEWQNELCEQERWAAARDYWRKQLHGIGGGPELPLEKPEQAAGIERFELAEVSLKLEPGIWKAIRSLARLHETANSTVLLACWQTLLWRLTNRSDLIVGQLFDGRKIENLRHALGLLSKYLPIRIPFEENFEFRELLHRVDRIIRDAHTQQEYFSWEQSAEGKASGAEENPLAVMPVKFDFEERPAPYIEGGIRWSVIRQYSCIDNFKLRLSGEVIEDSLELKLQYNTEFYCREAVERIAAQYKILLESAVSNDRTLISRLDILGRDESHKIFVEWNETKAPYEQDKCLHQLFAEQAARTPERPAVIFEDEQLSYARLNCYANQLARYLQRLGVGPETRVGICLERSVWAVVSVLGILKAGGAYVPLDPLYPSTRLAYMLEDARAPVLLTQRHLLASLPEVNSRVVCLDEQWGTIAEESMDEPDSKVTAQNLAYVIYTSGSTGRPKGTMVQHRSIINLAAALRHAIYGEVFGETEAPLRISLNAPLAFDSSVKQLVQLLGGHTLYIIPEQVRIDGHALLDYIAQQKLDVFECTPAQLKLTLGDPEEKIEMGARLVLVGGEAIENALWRELAQQEQTVFYNVYGPTECTVDATISRIENAAAKVRIGRAIANVQVYILDRWKQGVPVGVVGEIYIGGDGVARGYLERPDLTAERFIPDPFSKEAGARLYKTGDLGLYLENGEIECLGRADNQVKIRGYRIELDEIKEVLMEEESIKEAAVLLLHDSPSQHRLVAYLVPLHPHSFSLHDLRSHLRSRLPDYMLPSAFLLLDRLPLNQNGKLDRSALPSAEASRSAVEAEFAAPTSFEEQTLATIWAQVLGLSEVGIHDNFFELGGDSILSIQIIARARQAGLHLTPRQLFQHQSIAELAEVAARNAQSSAASDAPAGMLEAPQGEVTGFAVLTPIQHWFFSLKLSAPSHFNQSLMLRCPEGFDPGLMPSVIRQLLSHHDALRARFETVDGRWQQRLVSMEEAKAAETFAMVDLSGVSEEELLERISQEADQWQRTLNLDAGPLCRFVYFECGEGRSNRLLIVIHHLVIDGVSWRIVLEDLWQLYQQAKAGERLELAAKTNTVQQWGEYLERLAGEGAFKGEMEYWLGAVEERGEEVRRMPVDNREGSNLQADVGVVQRALSRERTRELVQEVPGVYGTQIQEVLLTALEQAWRRWSGRGGEVLVEVEGHGREWVEEERQEAGAGGEGETGDGRAQSRGGAEIDVTRTVGWFTTIYPVRLRVRERSHAGEAIKEVKEQMRRVPRGGLGYGVLRYLSEEEEVRAKMEAVGGAEVLFNYLGQFEDRAGSGNKAEESAEGRVEGSVEGFELTGESSGAGRDEEGERHHVLVINAVIARGRLQMEWEYSMGRQRRERVEEMAREYEEELEKLIEHCVGEDAGGYTPSDFPDVNLSQAQLDLVLKKVGKNKHNK